MGTKSALILVAIFVLSIRPLFAESAPLADNASEKPSLELESLDSAAEGTERREEITKYKEVFLDLSENKVDDKTIEYDSEGRVSNVQFNDGSIAYYKYISGENKELETVLINYEGIQFSLAVETNEIIIDSSKRRSLAEYSGERAFPNFQGQIDDKEKKIDPENLIIDFPVLKKILNTFNSKINKLFDDWDSIVETNYYDALRASLGNDLKFWLGNLNSSNLQNKIKIDGLAKFERRKAIDETTSNILKKAKYKTNLTKEQLDFISIEQYLRYNLLIEMEDYLLMLDELLDNLYLEIEEFLKGQDIPVIVESADDINILIALPELPEIKSETEN